MDVWIDMKVMIILMLFMTFTAHSEQYAETAVGDEVVLYDSKTWMLVHMSEETAAAEKLVIWPIVATKDSQLVLLREKTWEFLTPDDSVGTSYAMIDRPVMAYYAVEEPPEVCAMQRPVYPWGAAVKGHEGKTTVKALIGTDGQVMAVDILESSGYMELDQAAKKAAWKARFNRATHKGHPVRVWVSMPFTFTLRYMELQQN
jgi:TonB family protein